MHPAPTTCPVCALPLHATRLACAGCETAIEGRFTLDWLGRLSREQLAFVRVFLECRGKIKDVEGRLGVSYPTVIARLDEVVQSLGSPVVAAPARPATDSEGDILDALSRGELTTEQAAARIRALGPGGSR